jgi:acylphosphatase
MRKHIIVSGSVQGVGFRYFVCELAMRFNVTGWVQNCDDGTVEIEAQGSELAIDNLVERLKVGSRFSHVENVVYNSIEDIKDEKKFRYR